MEMQHTLFLALLSEASNRDITILESILTRKGEQLRRLEFPM